MDHKNAIILKPTDIVYLLKKSGYFVGSGAKVHMVGDTVEVSWVSTEDVDKPVLFKPDEMHEMMGH